MGIEYNQQLNATGTQLITWSIDSGSLPDGLALDSANGTISGIPSVIDNFTFTVKAMNSEGIDTKALAIEILAVPVAPVITTASLTNGMLTKAYNQTLTATGTAPVTWSLDSGSLPNGLTISANGTISGIPTAEGLFTFTVKAINAAGSNTKSLSIKIELNMGPWTAQTAAENNMWISVTYGNGLFVAVSYDGTNRVMTSPDGITWTARTASENNHWNSVTYGNGLFVAVAFGRLMTSPDGITWTARTIAVNNQLFSVTYGNGLFVAVTFGSLITSPDGITWTERTAENNSWLSVTYGNGRFVAVATSGTNRVMTAEWPY